MKLTSLIKYGKFFSNRKFLSFMSNLSGKFVFMRRALILFYCLRDSDTPKYVKVIRSKKTDKKDSKWIANIFKQDLLKYSFIPPKNIRELRKISHYRIKLVNKRSSERNRYQNCMTVSNIALASVSTDHLGKNCKAAMDEILKSDIITEDNLKKILKGSVSKKSDQIFQAIQNSHIESDQRFKINCTIKHMNNLDEYIQNWLVFETTSCSMCSFGYQE